MVEPAVCRGKKSELFKEIRIFHNPKGSVRACVFEILSLSVWMMNEPGKTDLHGRDILVKRFRDRLGVARRDVGGEGLHLACRGVGEVGHVRVGRERCGRLLAHGKS